LAKAVGLEKYEKSPKNFSCRAQALTPDTQAPSQVPLEGCYES